MDQDAGQNLTAAEVAAFVAQWAEEQPTTADELARRLGIDPTQQQSLLNQSRGRLSMEKWTSQKKPKTASAVGSYNSALATGFACVVLGALAVYFFAPKSTPPKPAELSLPPGMHPGPKPGMHTLVGLTPSPGPGGPSHKAVSVSAHALGAGGGGAKMGAVGRPFPPTWTGSGK